MLSTIFILLIVFQIKHYLADFILQTPYMIQKFKPDWGFFFPLLTHSAIHGVFTLAICLTMVPGLWWLALVDIVAHFVMDRIKAGPKYLGRFKVMSAYEMCEANRTTKCVEDYKKHPNEYVECDEWINKIGLKVRKQMRGNCLYFYALGIDQLFHHLSHYFFIWMLVS